MFLENLTNLIIDRNKLAGEIGELIAERDAIGGRIGVLRDRLMELNDEIEYAKTEEEHEEKVKAWEFEEALESNDYSLLAREYRRLNKEINKWRKCREGGYKDGDQCFSIVKLREERRRVGDKLLEIERCEQAGVAI